MANTTVEKQILSGSTNGLGIKVAATATAGTAIHTATNVSGVLDYLTLYAFNEDTADILLTIEFGGVTVPDNVIRETVHARAGMVLVVPGIPLRGGLAVAAFAGTANKITIYGYVERATVES